MSGNGPLKDYPKGLISAINDVMDQQNDLYSMGLMQKYGISVPQASTPEPVEADEMGTDASDEIKAGVNTDTVDQADISDPNDEEIDQTTED